MPRNFANYRHVAGGGDPGVERHLLLGGLTRVISWIDLGQPHWLQIAEIAVELVVVWAEPDSARH